MHTNFKAFKIYSNKQRFEISRKRAERINILYFECDFFADFFMDSLWYTWNYFV